jgi:hypothetical protein
MQDSLSICIDELQITKNQLIKAEKDLEKAVDCLRDVIDFNDRQSIQKAMKCANYHQDGKQL